MTFVKSSMRARVDIIEEKLKMLQCQPYRRIATRRPTKERVDSVEKWLTTRSSDGSCGNFLRLPGDILGELRAKLETRAVEI